MSSDDKRWMAGVLVGLGECMWWCDPKEFASSSEHAEVQDMTQLLMNQRGLGLRSVAKEFTINPMQLSGTYSPNPDMVKAAAELWGQNRIIEAKAAGLRLINPE